MKKQIKKTSLKENGIHTMKENVKHSLSPGKPVLANTIHRLKADWPRETQA